MSAWQTCLVSSTVLRTSDSRPETGAPCQTEDHQAVDKKRRKFVTEPCLQSIYSQTCQQRPLKGNRKSGCYWQAAAIDRKFSQGGGGDFEWSHEIGDRYWKGATKTGLPVHVSNLVNLYVWIPLLCLAFDLTLKQDFNGKSLYFYNLHKLHLYIFLFHHILIYR